MLFWSNVRRVIRFPENLGRGAIKDEELGLVRGVGPWQQTPVLGRRGTGRTCGVLQPRQSHPDYSGFQSRTARPMFRALSDFITEITGGEREVVAFADGDYRLAAAALLVHVMSIDGAVTAEEQAILKDILARRFDLSPEDTEALLDLAIAKDAEAVDLYAFTSVLNRALDDEGRRRIVEMMFEVAYADGGLSEFEDNLVWRAAELLNVGSRERTRIRREVRDETEGDGEQQD